MTRPCPRCKGSGEIHSFGYAVNPFSGVQVNDPQMEQSATCPRCDGEGVLDAQGAGPVSKQQPQRDEAA